MAPPMILQDKRAPTHPHSLPLMIWPKNGGRKMDDPLPPLRQVIDKYDLQAKKNLGQNFLLDLNITRKIARYAGDLSQGSVIEIGPGPGGLTRAILMEGAQNLVVVERDERVRPALEDISNAYPNRLHIRFEDALAADIFENTQAPVKIIANLPYNIGTELLIRWLRQDWPPQWASLTLMFQEEVADRITARPGDKHWGRLAVLANWRADTAKLYRLPPSAFTPPPKVNSAVVQIIPCEPKLDVQLEDLERVTKAAFGQRRKMLRAALKSLNPNAENMIAAAGIDPTRRGETLDLQEFGALSKAFAKN